MSEHIRVPIQIELEYYHQPSSHPNVVNTWLVDPKFTDELQLAVYEDDDTLGVSTAIKQLGRLQVELAGSPRALEELGRFLIAMARMETDDPNIHDHFDDVQDADRETAHFIVRRLSEEGASSLRQAMIQTFNRIVPLLEADVVATLGEQYRHVVRDAIKYLDHRGLAGYEEKVVENVQQEFHDTFIDTTWPACPRHHRHPLWYNADGWWWCEKDRVALCKLGELGTLTSRIERRP